MSQTDIIQALGFSLPMFAALVCGVMLLMYYRRSDEFTQRKLTILMILTYTVAVMCWLGIILYVVDYDGFVWFNTLFFFSLMLDQVLLYHFVSIITGTGTRRRFNPVNYVIPLGLTLAMGIWSLAVPYEVQYFIVESRGEVHPGYPAYSYFFSATVPIFIIYNILYPLLGLNRIRIYRREVVNYSADEERASARWLYMLIFLIWLTLPIASGVLFVHKSRFFSSALTALGAFLPIFQYLIICYNLISGNYVIIHPPTREERKGDKRIKSIDRERFERYIRVKKPYLNPKLKITDMCMEMGTNRTYLSSFINQEYGMNFSRYINTRRLEELDHLRTDPVTASRDGIDLVLHAGFSSYRAYIRIKQQDDKQKTLKKLR